jgi:hypothetical protein
MDLIIEMVDLLRATSLRSLTDVLRAHREKVLAQMYGSPHELLTIACPT